MAMEVIRTVGIAGAPDRDYSTLTAWQAGEAKDLVAADEIAVAECYNDGVMSESFLQITGWTTDETHYIKIYTPESERHDGIFDTGFRYDGTSNYYPVIWIRVPNVRIEGLQIEDNANSHVMSVDIPSGSGWVEICYNLIRGRSNAEAKHALYVYTTPATVTVKIWNNMLTRSGRGVDVASTGGPVYIYNCTMWALLRGIYARLGSNVTAKNCVALNCGGNDFFETNFFNVASDYNASTVDVGSPFNSWAPGDNSMTLQVGDDNFVSPVIGSEDLHLLETAPIRGQGIELSSDPIIAFSDDIDGNTRSGAWDIGADQYGEGAPAHTPPTPAAWVECEAYRNPPKQCNTITSLAFKMNRLAGSSGK